LHTKVLLENFGSCLSIDLVFDGIFKRALGNFSEFIDADLALRHVSAGLHLVYFLLAALLSASVTGIVAVDRVTALAHGKSRDLDRQFFSL